ncbi:hypothetical protein ONZ45_g16185 [Pleurotus djamor]|nr:hypothetical protein ONZ45_g16185 [Pleurotus djamor]
MMGAIEVTDWGHEGRPVEPKTSMNPKENKHCDETSSGDDEPVPEPQLREFMQFLDSQGPMPDPQVKAMINLLNSRRSIDRPRRAGRPTDISREEKPQRSKSSTIPPSRGSSRASTIREEDIRPPLRGGGRPGSAIPERRENIPREEPHSRHSSRASAIRDGAIVQRPSSSRASSIREEEILLRRSTSRASTTRDGEIDQRSPSSQASPIREEEILRRPDNESVHTKGNSSRASSIRTDEIVQGSLLARRSDVHLGKLRSSQSGAHDGGTASSIRSDEIATDIRGRSVLRSVGALSPPASTHPGSPASLVKTGELPLHPNSSAAHVVTPSQSKHRHVYDTSVDPPSRVTEQPPENPTLMSTGFSVRPHEVQRSRASSQASSIRPDEIPPRMRRVSMVDADITRAPVKTKSRHGFHVPSMINPPSTSHQAHRHLPNLKSNPRRVQNMITRRPSSHMEVDEELAGDSTGEHSNEMDVDDIVPDGESLASTPLFLPEQEESAFDRLCTKLGEMTETIQTSHGELREDMVQLGQIIQKSLEGVSEALGPTPRQLATGGGYVRQSTQVDDKSQAKKCHIKYGSV